MSQERLVRIRFSEAQTHRFFIRVAVRCAIASGYDFIAPESTKPFKVKLDGNELKPKNIDRVWLSLEELEAVDFNQFGSYDLEGGEMPLRPIDRDNLNGQPAWRWELSEWLRGSSKFEWAQFCFPEFFFTGKTPFQPEANSDYWHYLICEAKEYYFMRCLYRALRARTLHSRLNGSGRATHPNYIFRRNSRRSKIIPAFEDYCHQVGFACVDDLDSPVVRVPDFVPTGPVFATIGSVDD